VEAIHSHSQSPSGPIAHLASFDRQLLPTADVIIGAQPYRWCIGFCASLLTEAKALPLFLADVTEDLSVQGLYETRLYLDTN
jgi:hypothetical protein